MASEALKAVEEGEAILKSGRSSFFGLISSPPDYQLAVDKFNLAGNLFKAAGEWQAAGDAYLRASQACLKDDNPEEAARRQLAAASCFRKVPGLAEKAVGLIEQANETYIRSGRFAMVGNNEKECGEIMEKEVGDRERAIDFYARAAQRYMSALGCKMKEALLAAELAQYDRAVKIFEQAARNDSADATRRFNTKEYLFKDLIGGKRQIAGFSSIDMAFGASREGRLLEALLAALEENSEDDFTAAVSDFEKINRLDDWKVDMLVRAKRLFTEEPSLA